MGAMYGMMIAMRDDERAAFEALPQAAFVARVFGGASSKSALMEDHERTLHLETLWAAVDFVLTGKTLGVAARAPLDFLRPTAGSSSGDVIGPDLGRGPARYVSPARIRVIASALERLDDHVIEARVSSPELAHVVPFSNADDDDDELLVLAQKTISASALGADLENAEPTTAEELVGRIKPRRRERPTPNERAEIRDAIDELRAFVAKLVRDGAGALVVIA